MFEAKFEHSRTLLAEVLQGSIYQIRIRNLHNGTRRQKKKPWFYE